MKRLWGVRHVRWAMKRNEFAYWNIRSDPSFYCAYFENLLDAIWEGRA